MLRKASCKHEVLVCLLMFRRDSRRAKLMERDSIKRLRASCNQSDLLHASVCFIIEIPIDGSKDIHEIAAGVISIPHSNCGCRFYCSQLFSVSFGCSRNERDWFSCEHKTFHSDVIVCDKILTSPK